MQVIADNIKNAESVLGELTTAITRVTALCEAATPLREAMKQGGPRKSPPVYVAETGKKMKENFIEDFGAEFPTLSSGISNGWLGSASYRLHDGIYKLGTSLITMKERKFMVMSDEERATLCEALKDVLADFAIYTIIAFQLHLTPGEQYTLAVSKLCERRQVKPAIFYGEMLQVIESTGRKYYAYEPLSPVYNDMLATEPAFLAECEEQRLPLTEEMAMDILSGELLVTMALDQLLKENSEMESTEVDVNPMSLISRMNLE